MRFKLDRLISFCLEMSCQSEKLAVAPSLLQNLKIKPVLRQFDLGMHEFVSTDDFLPEQVPGATSTAKGKENKVSLSLKKGKSKLPSEALKLAPLPKRVCKPLTDKNEGGGKQFDFSEKDYSAMSDDKNEGDGKRFDFSEKDYSAMSVPFVPRNTRKNNSWAYNNFMLWREERNLAFPEDPCPSGLLDTVPWNVEGLTHWLSRYACETRNKSGSKYPASTVYSLLSGLLRHMRSVDPDCPNFLDTKDSRFKGMHNVIDAYFRSLRQDGIGAEVKHTSLVSKQEENALWEQGVLGLDSPLSLLRAVFFYNGKNFCLRGGKEHRELKLSQLVREKEPDRYVYIENGSKNRSGGLWQLHVDNKIVPIYACDEAGDRCHVRLLDKYISKLSPKAIEKDFFYMRALENVSGEAKVWYSNQPCGENKLSSMVKEMCAQVGICGKTNHSLRATGATELFRAGVPEKIIQDRTGKSLRMYERTTARQHAEVSRVLVTPTGKDYSSSRNTHSEVQNPSNFHCSSLFGSTSHCVINVNFAPTVQSDKEGGGFTKEIEKCLDLDI